MGNLMPIFISMCVIVAMVTKIIFIRHQTYDDITDIMFAPILIIAIGVTMMMQGLLSLPLMVIVITLIIINICLMSFLVFYYFRQKKTLGNDEAHQIKFSKWYFLNTGIVMVISIILIIVPFV